MDYVQNVQDVNFSLSISDRCRKLIQIARQYEALIFCDDVYNMLHYEGKECAPPRLLTYDNPSVFIFLDLSHPLFCFFDLKPGWLSFPLFTVLTQITRVMLSQMGHFPKFLVPGWGLGGLRQATGWWNSSLICKCGTLSFSHTNHPLQSLTASSFQPCHTQWWLCQSLLLRNPGRSIVTWPWAEPFEESSFWIYS